LAEVKSNAGWAVKSMETAGWLRSWGGKVVVSPARPSSGTLLAEILKNREGTFGGRRGKAVFKSTGLVIAAGGTACPSEPNLSPFSSSPLPPYGPLPQCLCVERASISLASGQACSPGGDNKAVGIPLPRAADVLRFQGFSGKRVAGRGPATGADDHFAAKPRRSIRDIRPPPQRITQHVPGKTTKRSSPNSRAA